MLIKLLLQIYSVVHGIMRVKLLDLDEGRLVSVNQVLISMGYAVRCEELYLSKVNHFSLIIPSKIFHVIIFVITGTPHVLEYSIYTFS